MLIALVVQGSLAWSLHRQVHLRAAVIEQLMIRQVPVADTNLVDLVLLLSSICQVFSKL